MRAASEDSMSTIASFGELLSTLWTIWAVGLFGGIAYWAWRPANP